MNCLLIPFQFISNFFLTHTHSFICIFVINVTRFATAEAATASIGNKLLCTYTHRTHAHARTHSIKID